MVKFLLLDAGFKLSLVLQGLSAHFFLTSNTLFVGFPALVSHLLFLLEHLLVSLQIELHLVFGLPLVHFELKLLGLPTFFFCYLRFLHLQLATNMKKKHPYAIFSFVSSYLVSSFLSVISNADFAFSELSRYLAA
jgi:hypothetical protein